MSWIQPKVSWVPEDTINAADFNRIRDNILYLQDEAKKYYSLNFLLESRRDYKDVAYVEIWNNLEDGLEKLYEYIPFIKYSGVKHYKIYDPYIDFNELNRLEKLCADYKHFFDTHIYNIDNLGFKLGDYGGVKN